jgi:hypothetical protein
MIKLEEIQRRLEHLGYVGGESSLHEAILHAVGLMTEITRLRGVIQDLTVKSERLKKVEKAADLMLDAVGDQLPYGCKAMTDIRRDLSAALGYEVRK